MIVGDDKKKTESNTPISDKVGEDLVKAGLLKRSDLKKS
jgi:hypothetical protein